MRAAVVVIGMMLCLCSCQQSPQEKAVEEYIQNNFNDPSSYERVKLSKVQNETLIFHALEMLWAQKKENGWSDDYVAEKQKGLRSFMESKGWNPDSVIYRYVDHSYRSNNALGAKILHHERWYLNEDLTTVVRIEPK